MTIALYIVGGLLALLYVAAGLTKTFTPKPKLLTKMPYTEDFTAWQVKAIGILEILGALGLVLPTVTGIFPVLAPIAALGLAVVQIVAIVVHVRRREFALVFNIVLLVAALFVGVVGLIVL